MNKLENEDRSDVKIAIDSVIKEVAKFYNITPQDIYKKSRKGKFRTPRQFVQYILMVKLEITSTRIAQEFDQTHATVLNSKKKIGHHIETYKDYKQAWEFIKTKVEGIKLGYDNPNLKEDLLAQIMNELPNYLLQLDISLNDLNILGDELKIDKKQLEIMKEKKEQKDKEEREDKLIKHHKDEFSKKPEQIKQDNGEEVFGIRK